MQLREHPSMMGRWPPDPGGRYANSKSAPANCLDTLVGARYFSRREIGLLGITLRTALKNEHYVREIFIYDEEFAKAVCKFLRRHKGATVQSIGELDVTLELPPCLV
jgi:hypothetical protein